MKVKVVFCAAISALCSVSAQAGYIRHEVKYVYPDHFYDSSNARVDYFPKFNSLLGKLSSFDVFFRGRAYGRISYNSTNYVPDGREGFLYSGAVFYRYSVLDFNDESVFGINPGVGEPPFLSYGEGEDEIFTLIKNLLPSQQGDIYGTISFSKKYTTSEPLLLEAISTGFPYRMSFMEYFYQYQECLLACGGIVDYSTVAISEYAYGIQYNYESAVPEPEERVLLFAGFATVGGWLRAARNKDALPAMRG